MQKAESLKASGTQKYQRGDFLGALADYLSALEVVSSGNPLEKSTTPNLTVVIESNISAVLYEFGSYTDSLAHSQKVLDLLSDVQQLSAKEESIKDKNVKRMEKIQKITIHHENFGDGKTQDPVAREIIRKLPRYRPMRLTEAMEMYVGHDPAASALRLARDDQLVDETSEKGDRRNLTVDEVWKKAVDIFSEDEKGGSTYSVFYGGCGDGRHYMMTLIDLARQISRGGGNCSRSFNFVLNDIHPVVIARLHWSSNYRRPSLSLQPPQKTYRERAPREMPRSVCSFSLRAFSSPRIYAMVFLPAVKEAIEAAEKLLSQIEGGREEPGWKAVLFGVSLDAPTLRSAVVRWREWHAGANTVSNKEARRGWSVDPTENDRAVGMDFRALASAHPEMQEVRAQKVQEEKDRIRQMVMSQSEEEFRSSCDQAIQTSLVEQGVITEGQWISLSLDEQKEVVVKQLSGLVEDRLDKRDVWGPVKDWKTNPSVCLKVFYIEKMNADGPPPPDTEPPPFEMCFEPCQLAEELFRAAELSSERLKGLIDKPPRQSELFDYFSFFFWTFGKALQDLGGMQQTSLLCCDVNEAVEGECPLLSPEDSKFDRVFLSNVPDYTGYLPVLTTCAAAIKHLPSPSPSETPSSLSSPSAASKMPNTAASIQSNVMLNAFLFPSYATYLFNGAFLDIADTAKLLGIKCTQDKLLGTMRSVFDNRWVLAPLPSLPSQTGPSLPAACPPWALWGLQKSQAQEWLKSLLVHLLIPPKQDIRTARQTCRATMPLNATNFFRTVDHVLLAKHLRWPPHWVTEVLQEVISHGQVESRLNLPPTQHPPTPPSFLPSGKTVKVGVRPFVEELKTLCAVFGDSWGKRWGDRQGGNPYAGLVGDLPRFEDLCKYRLKGFDLYPARLFGMTKNSCVGLAIVRAKPREWGMPAGRASVFGGMGGSMGRMEDLLRQGPPIDILKELSAGKVIHMFTTVGFCSARKSAQFLLPKKVFEDLKEAPDVCVVLLVFTLYSAFSHPKRLADAVATKDLNLSNFEE